MSESGHLEKPGLSIDTTEFRLGWRVLALCVVGIGTGVSTATLYSFSSFVVPLQQAFGWSREQIQPAIGVQYGFTIVSVLIAGSLIRRFGLRAVTLVSLLTLPLGYWVMSLNTGAIWQLYAGFGLLAFAGMGTMQVTWTQLVNLWFERNRGLALAIMLCGTGLAAIVYPTAISWVIERWGWRAGFWLLALLPLLLTWPMALRWLNVNSPSVTRRLGESRQRAAAGEAPLLARLPGMDLRQVARSWRFWLCNLSLSLVVAGMIALVTSTIPMLRDRGLSATDAAAVFSVFGLSLIIGRVLVGYLVDRLWAPGVAAVVMMLPAVGSLLYFTLGVNIPGLMLASILVGLGAGAEMDIAAFMVARYFGMRDYSRAFSLHMGVISLVSTVAPLLFAVLYARTGSYSTMLAVCMAAFAVGAILLLAMGRYPDFNASADTAGGSAP